MAAKRLGLLFGLTGVAVVLLSCMDQYDPRPDWKQFEKERTLANQEQPELTEEGKIPGQKGAGDGGPDIEQAYQTYCASCHGATGEGDGAAGKSLDPSPRDFTDPQWQKEVSDERIAKVIREGGAAVGLSAQMAPWGGALSDAEVEGLVKMVRDFGSE